MVRVRTWCEERIKVHAKPYEIRAKSMHISRICLKNPRVNFPSLDRLKARAFSAAEIRAWNGEEAISELTEWLLKSLLLFSNCEICTCMLSLFKKCNMSANNYRAKKKKKMVSIPVFSCLPQYFFSSYRKKKKKKKKNVPMPGPRRVIAFFWVFFNFKSSVFSVCQREYVTGRHGQKSRPSVAHFAEEKQNPFSNPYVDSHGSAQIRHWAMTHNSGTFSLPV